MILVNIISVIAGLSIGYYAAKKFTSVKKRSQIVSLAPGAIIDFGKRKSIRTEPDTHEKGLKVADPEIRVQVQQLPVKITLDISNGNTYDLIKEQYDKWKIRPNSAIK